MSAFKRIFGYKPKDLHDFVKARLLRDVEKHYKEGGADFDDFVDRSMKSWDNQDLLLAISFALRDMKKAGKNV
jgi:hypothetical protein